MCSCLVSVTYTVANGTGADALSLTARVSPTGVTAVYMRRTVAKSGKSVQPGFT